MPERSKELIKVGYFLSRFGKNKPPSLLNVAKWKDAYKLFYDQLNEGRTALQFEHSLKNSRDAFDGYFSETEREGWKADDGSPTALSGYSLDIYKDYENLNENEVFLKIESFMSKSNKNDNFSWVPTYKAIVQFLKDKQDDQIGLIDLLKDSGCDLFKDQNPENNVIELEEIDPFTFFCYINKYFKKRLEILQNLAKSINAPVPLDDHGIPSANSSKIWMFPFKFMRNNTEIDRLWKFFHNAIDNTISNEQFEDILEIRGVAITKITEALFYADPETYFPINGPTKTYLEQVLEIEPIFKNFTEYKNILDRIKIKSNKPLYQLSYEAEQWNDNLNLTDIQNSNKTNTIDLNQIFFGPPGTGKTFHTINEAIKITDPEFYKIHKNDRDQLKARFKLLSLNNDNESVGQIGFTTFHQSFSYEDFIEGIKPNEPKEGDAFLKYEIQEGVFKKICRLADDSLNAVAVDTKALISLSRKEFEKAQFYKMSLGNTQDENDNEIYDYCIENNCITIGFGNQLDFTGKDEKELRSFGNDNDLDSFSIQAMNLFSNYLKIGNYVVISYGNKYVRAVGRVTGDYEYRDDSELPNNLHYKHFRSVEWIFADEKISANEIYNKNLSMQTIYKLDKKYIKEEFFVKEKKTDTHRLPKNPKNFVLIVDEINRGNVSSVFGELITLIEKDKRAGADEELSVTLPYSKETFSVPHNVYIIGTMNTADRSIEALDTALRRRFSFREMPPKPELIKTVGSLKNTNGKLGDIDVVKILKTINNRIEKLIDKDHKIGHSYFLNISSKQDLIDTFRDKVIPLLEEYFFGDFGKISLVLGSSFISKESADGVTFATTNDYDPSIANDLLERSVYEITSEGSWDFKAIYE